MECQLSSVKRYLTRKAIFNVHITLSDKMIKGTKQDYESGSEELEANCDFSGYLGLIYEY